MAWNEVWEEIFKEREWGKYPAEDLIRFVARNFYKAENRKEIKILEIGCGPGANLWYVAREGFTVYGIDGSETAVKKATQRLNGEIVNWSGEVIQADFTKIPYDDNYFDAVIDNESICINSFEDSEKITSEVYRVLKSNGKFYSRTFSTESWGDKTGENIGYNFWIVDEGPLKGTGSCRFTSEDDIYKLFKQFNIEELELLQRSYNNRENTVKEWMVIANK